VLSRFAGIFANKPTAFDAGCFQEHQGLPRLRFRKKYDSGGGADWADPLRSACTFYTSRLLSVRRDKPAVARVAQGIVEEKTRNIDIDLSASSISCTAWSMSRDFWRDSGRLGISLYACMAEEGNGFSHEDLRCGEDRLATAFNSPRS
jgi:hypothetical protein